MTTARISALIEKLFLMTLVGSCGFIVSYLHDINSSIQGIQARVSVACEQVSKLDASLEHVATQLAYLQTKMDYLHSSKN